MIGVVGGTLSGLAVAARLARQGRDVRVFEPTAELGGIAATTAAPGTDGTPLERVPISLARPRDDVALEFLAELGLADRLEWGPVRTAMYVEGTVHPVDTPWEFLAYPPLSLSDTARLAALRSGIDCRRVPRRRPRVDAYEPSAYADVPAEAFVREHAGDAVYERFYGPLLEARFGSHAPRVSAAWVLEHCRGERDRTRFGRERRGHFADSSAVLVEALVDAIGRENVVTNARVKGLEARDGAVESITVERGGASERRAVDAVALATVPEGLESPFGTSPLPIRTRTCLRVSTTAATPLTDADRVTMVDDAPFGELVTPTLRRSPDAFGGHQYYLLDGGQAAAAGRSLDAIERRWLEALSARFDAFDRNDLAAVESTRIRQPVPDHVRSGVAGVSLDSRSERVPDGVYDATIARQPQFPQRRVGGALETGLCCARAIIDADRRASPAADESLSASR